MPSYELKKHPDNGVYYVHWSEGRRSKRCSTRTRNLDEAQVWLSEWILMERRAGASPETTYTVAELWAVFKKQYVDVEVASPETLAFAWKTLGPHFGAMTVAEVDQAAVDDYVRKRTSGRLGGRVLPQTTRRELGALFGCLTWCAGQKNGRRKACRPALIPKAAINEVDLPPPSEARDRWLKTEEIRRLLAAAAQMRRGKRLSRGERFLWLALETAGRKQALLDLTWDRVDFETNVIHLDVPGRKQTKKRRADVPISSALRPILERAYRERENDLVLDNKGAVWATTQLIAIRAGFSEQKVGHKAKPKATGISPHVLRHTAATHMARRGVPLWLVAKVLGDTLATVEKIYAKHAPDDLRDAVDSISAGTLQAAE